MSGGGGFPFRVARSTERPTQDVDDAFGISRGPAGHLAKPHPLATQW